MPLVDQDDPAVWVSLYSYWTPNGFISGLLRPSLTNPSLVNMWQAEIEFIATACGISAASSIVIVGGGFGYRAELFAATYPGIAVDVVDTSQYIATRTGANAVLTINNDDITRTADRNRVLRRLSRAATHVISEDVLSILTDAEAQQFDAGCRAFNVPVCHLTSVLQPESTQDTRLNWKTGEQWRTLLPHQPGGGDPQWIISRPELAVF